MSPTAHIITSGIVSSLFGFFTRSTTATVICFIGGIFMDADHLLDYCFFKKKMCWHLSELKDYCAHEREGRMYLIFHSYESILVLWLCVYYFNLGIFWIGFILGMTTHLLFDQILNGIYPMAYFGFYRFRHGFAKIVLHDEDFRKELKKQKDSYDKK